MTLGSPFGRGGAGSRSPRSVAHLGACPAGGEAAAKVARGRERPVSLWTLSKQCAPELTRLLAAQATTQTAAETESRSVSCLPGRAYVRAEIASAKRSTS